MRSLIYLVPGVPRVPTSFYWKIEFAEGKPSRCHWNYRICITAASPCDRKKYGLMTKGLIN